MKTLVGGVLFVIGLVLMMNESKFWGMNLIGIVAFGLAAWLFQE